MATLNFLRTAYSHVFLATQWYRLHWYCFKKSLVQTDIEKTAPGNLSEHSVVYLSEYEHKEVCTGLRLDTPHSDEYDKNNSLLARGESVHR